MENFAGEQIKEATFSSPVQITGFNTLPEVGAAFQTFTSKREAEIAAAESRSGPAVAPLKESTKEDGEKRKKGEEEKKEEEEIIPTIPIVIKTDTQGSLDAILHELAKLENERIIIKVVCQGPGAVSENDIKSVAAYENALVIAFNTTADAIAVERARQLGIPIHTFNIIYKLAEWLRDAIAERTPKTEVREMHGSAKILKTFSRAKHKQVIGGRVREGVLRAGDRIVIMRRDAEIGEGKILSLEIGRAPAKEVLSGSEFGAQIETEQPIEEGDTMNSFSAVLK
jgi:translation initiation factor IF-2